METYSSRLLYFIQSQYWSKVCCDKSKMMPYSSSSLYAGEIFQDLQWMPETVASTEPYICIFFLYIQPTIKFNL